MPRHYRNKHGGDHGHTSTKAKHLRITKHPTQTRQQRRKHHPHRSTRQLVGFGRYPYSKGRLRPTRRTPQQPRHAALGTNDETLSHVFDTPVSVFDHNGRLLASYF
ncbi:hypothetical protein [Corynebacterium argentoratense]|uniref:hypothetical protein n=1 Tax=Corynebacterium argentoratense TaxID=42817 RepID=UPI0028D2F68B|nr:hypothetical protein [Corynebacterium argentoratense]